MIKIFSLALVIFISCPFGSAHAGKILTPDGYLEEPVWTSEELQVDISRKLIKNTEGASFFWIRLKGSETPHTHNIHDLTVVMIHGEALVHLGAKAEKVQTGDVIEIPRETVHWAENRGSKPALIYAVFTPFLEGKDYQPVELKNIKNS